MSELVVKTQGQERRLAPGRRHTIGRDPQAGLPLTEGLVSWSHGEIAEGPNGWVLTDTGSTNGTFVNGTKLTPNAPVPLTSGMTIWFGGPADAAESGVRVDIVTVPAPGSSGVSAVSADGTAPSSGLKMRAHLQMRADHDPSAAPNISAPNSAPDAPSPGGPASNPNPPLPPVPPAVPQPPAPPVNPVAHSPQAMQPPPPVPSVASAPGTHDMATFMAGDGDLEALKVAEIARQAHAGKGPIPTQRLTPGHTIKVGRAADNDMVLAGDLLVSRHHVDIIVNPDSTVAVHDLGAGNGTFINGARMPKGYTAPLQPGSTVGVGHTTLRVDAGMLIAHQDTGEVDFLARHLSVVVGKAEHQKKILRDVSFRAPQKSLIGVIGPSGSGKSTLLKALTGYQPATEGVVEYDDRNLYAEFDELRQRIGLVPQDDILHRDLTINEGLRYAAQLRFPAEVSTQEQQQRINEVLRELKLDVHADKKITSLSGGQRKRVSVAVELLTKPSLILLDEPTSGLDPGMDRDVMRLLRGLADDGRTVLVVTHSVAQLHLCDRVLVMAPGGAMGYYGPPEGALSFFGREEWADVFADFENYRDADWGGKWHGSQQYQQYVADVDAIPPAQATMVTTAAKRQKGQSWPQQVATLVRRYLSVITSDRGLVIQMAALPVVLGLVSLIIDPAADLLPLDPDKLGNVIPNSTATVVAMILAVGACLTGCANSMRELIKERSIYERERAVGLSRSAYIASKVLVLGAITAVQCLVMTLIACSVRGLPDDGLVLGPLVIIELAIPVIFLGITSMIVGLLISAAVKTSEQTMSMLVVYAIFQIVFGGTLFSLLGSPTNWFSWLMPARWGMAGMGNTLTMNDLFRDRENPDRLDPLWYHMTSHWFLSLTVLAVMSAVLLAAVALSLRKHEPEVMR